MAKKVPINNYPKLFYIKIKIAKSDVFKIKRKSLNNMMCSWNYDQVKYFNAVYSNNSTRLIPNSVLSIRISVKKEN